MTWRTEQSGDFKIKEKVVDAPGLEPRTS